MNKKAFKQIKYFILIVLKLVYIYTKQYNRLFQAVPPLTQHLLLFDAFSFSAGKISCCFFFDKT